MNEPARDYQAAMNEIVSNVDVRRLMIVVSHILVPALAMAMSDCLGGSSYPEELAWLPRNILPISGAALAICGILTTGVLARCHFGLVVNGSKMAKVLGGKFQEKGLNWLGVTTNFTALTAISGAAGLALVLASFGAGGALAILAAAAFVVLSVAYLKRTHTRANTLCARLESSWRHGDVPVELQEEHARLSLDATTSDIAIVVTMAAALFAGTFNSLTNIGGIADTLDLALPVATIKTWGVPALGGFTLASLLLSGRMVVRLRLALAEHSTTLAKLRDESDTPFAFRPGERTFLLYLIPHVLASTSATILAWSIGGATIGLIAGLVALFTGGVYYPSTLARARRRAGSTT